MQISAGCPIFADDKHLKPDETMKKKDYMWAFEPLRKQTPLKFDPPYPLDRLYTLPFGLKNSGRCSIETGEPMFEPFEQPLPRVHPVLDTFMEMLRRGEAFRSISNLCKQMGITLTEFSSFMRMMTGQSSDEFRTSYRLRMADDLLRYTRLPMSEVSRISGIGSPSTLSRLFRRVHRCTPMERRLRLQRSTDLHRYRL